MAPYEGLGFAFTAYFVFDPKKHLTYVDLEPRDPAQCPEIRFALGNTYGVPDITGSFDLNKWLNKESGNAIVYKEIGSCSIRYMALGEPNGQGGL